MTSPSLRSLSADDAELECVRILEEVTYTLEATDFEPPRLPEAVRRMLDLTSREEVRVRELHDAIETDAMLAAQLVKAVRSPAHGRLAVRSLRDAIVRLGNDSIRNVVMELALTGSVFRSLRYGPEVAQIQTHNRSVAHLARIVAKAARIPSETAFLCGLLHDLGMLLVFEIMDSADHDDVSPEAVRMAARRFHAEGSRRVAEAWGFAGIVVTVLAGHHGADPVDEEASSIIAALTLSEVISTRLKVGLPEDLDALEPTAIENSMATLKLGTDRIKDIVREGEQIVSGFGRRAA